MTEAQLRASASFMAGNHTGFMPWGAPQQHQLPEQLLPLGAVAAELRGQHAAAFPCTAPCTQAEAFPRSSPSQKHFLASPTHGSSLSVPPLHPMPLFIHQLSTCICCQSSWSPLPVCHPQPDPHSRAWPGPPSRLRVLVRPNQGCPVLPHHPRQSPHEPAPPNLWALFLAWFFVFFSPLQNQQQQNLKTCKAAEPSPPPWLGGTHPHPGTHQPSVTETSPGRGDAANRVLNPLQPPPAPAGSIPAARAES